MTSLRYDHNLNTYILEYFQLHHDEDEFRYGDYLRFKKEKSDFYFIMEYNKVNLIGIVDVIDDRLIFDFYSYDEYVDGKYNPRVFEFLVKIDYYYRNDSDTDEFWKDFFRAYKWNLKDKHKKLFIKIVSSGFSDSYRSFSNLYKRAVEVYENFKEMFKPQHKLDDEIKVKDFIKNLKDHLDIPNKDFLKNILNLKGFSEVFGHANNRILERLDELGIKYTMCPGGVWVSIDSRYKEIETSWDKGDGYRKI